jgi:septal ring factor EnvC (AmiA/AmiB activator)
MRSRGTIPSSISQSARFRILISFLVALLAFVAVARADESPAEQRARIHQQIDQLQRRLQQTRSQRDSARASLRDLERQINRQGQALHRTKRRLRKARRKLHSLEAQQARKETGMASQRRALEQEARTALIVGRQPYLMVLFNQQKPDTVSRVMTYYHYFAQARARRITELRDKLTELGRLQISIRGETRSLEQMQSEYEQTSRELAHSRSARRILLASLDRRVQDQSDRIASLRRAEQRLDHLMGQLQVKEASGNEIMPTGVEPFSRLRGKLPMPAAGRITGRFGTRRPGYGDLRWKGIFIQGHEGEDVHAIYPGKVVFANHLDGYGLLLIIEHGDGYMTLYGNNESLYKKVGDPVEAGQVIASMGTSTGRPIRPGLYFEVRRLGKPSNPLRWCASR